MKNKFNWWVVDLMMIDIEQEDNPINGIIVAKEKHTLNFGVNRTYSEFINS